MRLLFVAVVVLVVSACFASDGVRKPPRDEEIYQNTLEENAWKRLMEKRMQSQVAGQKSPWRGESWKEYWTAWYSGIRISPALPWKGSEFKNHEDMIGYIKSRLKAHGLPAYE
jgi:hypothetical protein